MINLKPLDKSQMREAQQTVTENHYLHRPVDSRCSVEGYAVWLDYHFAGYLIFGRPEATRCGDWYGSVDEAQAGKCEVTRWQVLNLARVWIHPAFQYGGMFYSIDLPGYLDRKGAFRSTLASSILKLAIHQIGFDYLIRRPPCFLEEPYQIRWLLSYCDTRLHKGTIYREAGFELHRTNDRGIQTWRIRLPELTAVQDARVREAARVNLRSIRYRAKRAQMELFI